MRISDWSSDVCSSDLWAGQGHEEADPWGLHPRQRAHVELTGRQHIGDTENRRNVGLAIDHAMEDIHVPEYQANLFRGHHHIGAGDGFTLDRKSTRLNSSH